MRFVRWLGMAFAVLVALAGATFVSARFADGPLGPIPGGKLVAGELVTDPGVDWSFARDARELEIEIAGRSRTTWLVVHGGALYVPAGFMRSARKQWPYEALEKPVVVVRLDGRRFERTAVRLADDAPERAAILEALATKYAIASREGSGPEDVWLFRMDPR